MAKKLSEICEPGHDDCVWGIPLQQLIREVASSPSLRVRPELAKMRASRLRQIIGPQTICVTDREDETGYPVHQADILTQNLIEFLERPSGSDTGYFPFAAALVTLARTECTHCLRPNCEYRDPEQPVPTILK